MLCAVLLVGVPSKRQPVAWQDVVQPHALEACTAWPQCASQCIAEHHSPPLMALNCSTCLQDDIVHEDLTVRENLEYSAW